MQHLSRLKALKLYCNLILKRIKEPIGVNAKGICEIHHIIPKCIFKNKKLVNSKKNLISLYIHEHFLAHYYLACIFPNISGVQQAYYLMSNMKGRKQWLEIEELAFAYEIAKLSVKTKRKNKSYRELYGSTKSENIKIKQKKSKLDQMVRFIPVDK